MCCVFPDTLAKGADWASCDLKLKESGRLQIQIYILDELWGGGSMLNSIQSPGFSVCFCVLFCFVFLTTDTHSHVCVCVFL